ncbi:MAG: hypothetical protein JW892_06020 [Anaerolineae bacterium]|nr:hypothetical protein [Anaerolineae bacterium]
MLNSQAYTIGLQTGVRSDGSQAGSAEEIRQALIALRQRVSAAPLTAADQQAQAAIIKLSQVPEIATALAGRRDHREALRDLAIRYAFEQLMVERRALGELDLLSQALVKRTFDIIEMRARQVERRRGENPIDVEPKLLMALAESIARYVPRKPLGGHIQWKLNHCESAVSRAMRQVAYLVTRDAVTESFVDFVLSSPAAPQLQAQLLHLARGGGLTGVDYAAVIRFFALPETVAWVKRFASTEQTARTFYAEVEYTEMAWCGKRKLPVGRTQGYLEAALAELQQSRDVWLDHLPEDDDDDDDRHERLGDAEEYLQQEGQHGLLHRESFEAWLVHQALATRPDDALWNAAAWRYVEGLPAAAIVERGLTDANTLAAAEARLAELRADPDIWQIWVENTIA